MKDYSVKCLGTGTFNFSFLNYNYYASHDFIWSQGSVFWLLTSYGVRGKDQALAHFT